MSLKNSTSGGTGLEKDFKNNSNQQTTHFQLHNDNSTPLPKPLFWKRTRKSALIHLVIWLILTLYIALVIGFGGAGKDGFAIAMLIYTFISLRLFAQHVSVSQLIYTPFIVGKPSSSNLMRNFAVNLLNSPNNNPQVDALLWVLGHEVNKNQICFRALY